MQNEVDKPTRLLQFVAFVHLPFSFLSLNLFCSFTLVYEGLFVLCYKEKIELLDRVKQILSSVAIWPVTGHGFQNTKWPAVRYFR